MVQRKKEEVRERILQASLEIFATYDFRDASMAQIAKLAKVSTGNLYRYFQNKEALFAEAVPQEFAREHLAIIRKRVHSLSLSADLESLDNTAERDGQELLRFWLNNRFRVICLLRGAEGSGYEYFPKQFVEELHLATVSALKKRLDVEVIPAQVNDILRDIFANTVNHIIAILSRNSSEENVTSAFQYFWSYQLGGLAGLERKIQNEK